MKRKILIVYYSLTGNTHSIANKLKINLHADLERIKPIKELNPNNPTKFIWGGVQVLMHKKPKLKIFQHELNKYQNIIIGTPVWAFSYSAPINSLLSKNLFQNKKIALFCTSEGGEKFTLKNMKERLKNNEIISSRNFTFGSTELNSQALKEAEKWGKKLKTAFSAPNT